MSVALSDFTLNLAGGKGDLLYSLETMAAASSHRHLNKQKRGKLITVRVQGLAPGDYEDKASELCDLFLDEQMQGDELPVITILPACDPRERRLTALLDYKRGRLPGFLEGLSKDRYKRETYNLNGQRLNFDVHFHGFTQICGTSPPSSAVAE